MLLKLTNSRNFGITCQGFGPGIGPIIARWYTCYQK